MLTLTQEEKETTLFELVYGRDQGHGGPYVGLDAAINGAAAKLLGGRLDRIYIVPRSSPYEAEYSVLMVEKTINEDGDIVINVDPNWLRDERPFSSLSCGDRFYYDNSRYIVIRETIISHPVNMAANCIRLSDGELSAIQADTMIVRFQLSRHKA